MHVHAADDVAMACKPTLGVLAHPVPPTDFLAALAARTPARGTPFGAGETQDASLSTLLLKRTIDETFSFCYTHTITFSNIDTYPKLYFYALYAE